MQESIGHIIWSACYLSVLIGLSAYGIHRYFIIYLYLKNRKRPPVPSRYFENLPQVTVQLPIFNEVYVAERLLLSVSELDYPQDLLQIQVLDDSTDETREITAHVQRNCASAASTSRGSIGLIGSVLRLAHWQWDSLPRKANFFASSTPILFRKRTCSNAPFISLRIRQLE